MIIINYNDYFFFNFHIYISFMSRPSLISGPFIIIIMNIMYNEPLTICTRLKFSSITSSSFLFFFLIYSLRIYVNCVHIHVSIWVNEMNTYFLVVHLKFVISLARLFIQKKRLDKATFYISMCVYAFCSFSRRNNVTLVCGSFYI